MYEVKLSDGKYKFCQKYKDPRTNKYKTVSVTLPNNTKLYQQRALGILNDKIQKATSPSTYYSDITFKEVATEYLNSRENSIKATTYRNLSQDINRFVKFIGYDYILAQISYRDIEAYNNMLIANRFVSETIKKSINVIKQILKYARKHKYIIDTTEIEEYNIRTTPLTLEEIERKQNKYLTTKELRELIVKAYELDDIIGKVIEFQSLTGLRIGELLALRLKDYDAEKEIININGTIQNVKGRPRVAPKTTASIRSIPLFPRAKEILDNCIERLHSIKSIYGEQCNPDNYLFTTSKGGILENQYINKQLKKIPINNRTVSTHALRHTFASHMASKNIPQRVTMALLGHSDSSITTEIYTHVSQDQEKAAILELGNLYAFNDSK